MMRVAEVQLYLYLEKKVILSELGVTYVDKVKKTWYVMRNDRETILGYMIK